MMLKRLYDTPPDWVKRVNVRKVDGTLVDPTLPEGACLNPPPLKAVALAHTGTSAEQNFSDRLIAGAIAEEWVTISKGKLILHVLPEDLVYTVKRTPGIYCCHCGEQLVTQIVARAHVAAAHDGKASPDRSNPAGYRQINAWECVLDDKQHEKYRRRPGTAIRFLGVKRG